MYYDREGHPLDRWAWVAQYKDHENRVIEQTHIGEVLVSTVWIGLDMNFMHNGPPLIYETMVFGPHPLDEYQWRWATEDQAVKAHALIADRIRTEMAEETNGV